MDHKLILETLNKYQWQKKEWHYKEATQSYYSFSNRKVALLSSDDAYVIAMGLLYKAGAYDVILAEKIMDNKHKMMKDLFNSLVYSPLRYDQTALALDKVFAKSDSELTEWKIRKCNARLHHNYYEQTGYEVLQCAMEAGHKCQHWAVDAQGERINWNATIIQGLIDSDKVGIITDDAIL